MSNSTAYRSIPRIVYWGFIIIAAALITYGMIILFKNHPNVYYNNIFSNTPDDKGLTHTVIWAKKDGNSIDARIIVKNNTGKRVEYKPIYSLDCVDRDDNYLYVNECRLKDVYAIPDGESHQLDCVFTIKNEEENKKFCCVDFNTMRISVTVEYM